MKQVLQRIKPLLARIWGWKMPGAAAILALVLVLAGFGYVLTDRQKLKTDFKTQQQKIVTLQKDLAGLNDVATKLEGDKQALAAENQSLREELDQPAEEQEIAKPLLQDLRLAFQHAEINCCARGSGLDYVEVTVAMTNSHQETVRLDMKDFSLRDPDNGVIYPDFTSGIDLTTGKVRLLSADVEPGETIRGTIGFRVPVDIVDLTIKYKSQSHSFEVEHLVDD